MTGRVQSLKNYYFPTTQFKTGGKNNSPNEKNLSYYISPVQFARIKNDIRLWREAVIEAEQAFYPHRVKMQRIYQDTILNEHIESCMERRKDLTLLRDFKICDQSGEESKVLKDIFKSNWFGSFENYALDARFFGYSLISLGDVINDSFPELSVVRRQNVSPDRLNVTSYIYALSGENFMEDPYSRWHIWVPTPSELGIGRCGYGLLYKIAKTEIYLRNNTAFNADSIEIYGQPIRKGTTTKTDEAERAEFEAALRNMGSSAYILLDEGEDKLELVESNTTATGYQIFGDFEKRAEAKISKVLLGHADALDSTPGKLGSADGDESPAQKALRDKQLKDGTFMENIINNQLIPRMREIGFNIPIGYRFEYLNNEEKEKARRREDMTNKETAAIAQTMASGGLQMDAAYFQERTGIPTTAANRSPFTLPGQESEKPDLDKKNELPEKLKNKLNKIYRIK